MKTAFTKMHGLGNDFVLIDCRQQELDNMAETSKRLCDRRFGIGADQILLLYNSGKADFMMRIFNADGSEVEMCGNGIRCFAKYIWDRGLSEKAVLSIETKAGIIKPEKSGEMVMVDMGEPILEGRKIPVRLDGTVKDFPLKIDDRIFKITCVSMGNPHAVIFVDDVDAFDVIKYGPLIENHELFPKRINVEFIQVISPEKVKMRVWERGSGETMACGTGASAAVVAANINGLAGRRTGVILSGGELLIEWMENNHVYMTGPAVEVFDGTIYIDG
ncbi:MAG: diaminopimelate epimerase [Nitrospirota bacterium]